MPMYHIKILQTMKQIFETKPQSKKYKLNWHDIAKGLFISIGSAVLMFVQESVDMGDLVFDWKKIGMAAIGGAATYLIKNFFTDGK